jgi:hypothetical protein
MALGGASLDLLREETTIRTHWKHKALAIAGW